MRVRFLPHVLAAFLLAGAAGPGTAQQPSTPATGPASYREAPDDRMVVQPFNLTVDRIDDMDVHGTNGEKIGEVDEVLVDASGQPVAVSVEVGGFLGIGEQEVIMALDQLRLDGQRLVTSLTKQQIEALPRWDD